MGSQKDSGYVTFRPRARLLKLIGEELISDDIVAITELVKNAHDADASNVIIEFKRVTEDDAEIVVRDDGHGMDRDDLLGRWMEPACSLKTDLRNRRTARGRRMLGEKGVGRFAADKLARHLELVSRVPGKKRELVAAFDWDQYACREKMLSSVRTRWRLRRATEISDHGTLLRLTGLRARWNEVMFRRICTRLSRLVSPFDDQDDFSIRIESDEFPEYSGELRADLLDRAPYRIEAAFDGCQAIRIVLPGARPTTHPWNGPGQLQCGPVRARLFAFDLDTTSLAVIGPRTEVRAWLREWSGVSVFRDGFRIWPYGEPHDDWLRLDQRRVNNPVVRLSNNQVVGFVEISRDGNSLLKDQTNREGLIHNRALDDLRRIIYFAFQVLEAERQSVRHPDRGRIQAGVNTDATSDVAGSIELISRRAGKRLGSELRRVATRLRDEEKKRQTDRERELRGYSELAALGQAATQLHDSVQPVLRDVVDRCQEVRSSLNGNGSRRIKAALGSIKEQIEAIGPRLAMLAAMDDGGGRRRRAIDVPAELERCVSLFRPLLDEAGLKLEVQLPKAGMLRTEIRPESFHRLLHILFVNAIEWTHGRGDPKVRIHAKGTPKHCEITFSDNGPGIPAGSEERVFQPLFSGREGGRGMGLTIARELLRLNGGSIEALSDRRRRGATFRILFPRKRSRATVHR